MMKKTVSFILPLALVFCLCCCGGGGASSSGIISSSNISSTNSEPQPTLAAREPQQIGTMTMQQVFYRPKQADTVYLVDTSRLRDDEITALRCLQGAVARTKSAAIYLCGGEVDEFWRDYMSAEYGVYFKAADIGQLLETFADCYEGAVVYKNGGYEFCVAATMAAQQNKLLMSSAVYSKYSYCFDTETTERVGGRWASADEAYDYMYGQLMDGVNHNYVAVCDSDTPFLDYIFAAQAGCVDSVSRVTQFVEHLPVGDAARQPTVALVGEDISGTTLTVLSSSGCTSLNINSFTNGTVFASISVTQLQMRMQSYSLNPQPGNIYLAVTMASEGVHTQQNEVTRLWGGRNSVTRVSTEFSPILYEIAPIIANWYMLNCSQSDDFVAAGGWSDVDAAAMDSDIYLQWQMVNNKLLKACGISVVCDRSVTTADGLMKVADGSVAAGYVVGSDLQNSMAAVTSSSPASSAVSSVSEQDEQSAQLPLTVGYVDIDTIEQLADWIETLEADENSAQYYVVRLAHSGNGTEIYRQIDAVASNANNSGGVYKFVLAGDIFAAMD